MASFTLSRRQLQDFCLSLAPNLGREFPLAVAQEEQQPVDFLLYPVKLVHYNLKPPRWSLSPKPR